MVRQVGVCYPPVMAFSASFLRSVSISQGFMVFGPSDNWSVEPPWSIDGDGYVNVVQNPHLIPIYPSIKLSSILLRTQADT